MNRRDLARIAVAVIATIPVPVRATGRVIQATPDADPTIVDFMPIDGSDVADAWAATFESAGSSIFDVAIGAMQTLAVFGMSLRPGVQPDSVADDAHPAYTDWLVSLNTDHMSAESVQRVSVGRDAPGDGASAWTWKMNSSSSDAPWDEFAIACVAVWKGSDLLMMWALAASGTPVREMLAIADSAMAHWNEPGGGLLPTLDDLPAGMTERQEPRRVTWAFRD